MIYDHAVAIRNPLKVLEFYRSKERVMSILTETHIIHDPIQKKKLI